MNLFHLHDAIFDQATTLLMFQSLLRARLLHAEEISGSLRSEVAKVKRDCLELQGEKV